MARTLEINWISLDSSADWEDGDLNGDNIVDELDVDLAFAQYGLKLYNVVA